jgi:hypothetical protein
MALIVPTRISATSDVAVTQTTLDGINDTFVYKSGVSKYLILRNPTAAAITPTIDGNEATTQFLAGVGNVNISSGFAFAAIPAGATRAIDLKSISSYLAGDILITGGSGLVATLVE